MNPSHAPTWPPRAAPRLLSGGLAGALLASVLAFAPVVGAQAAPAFVAFESGHVRPIAQSPDGTRLFAVNTPNNTLEVFNVTPTGLQLAASVPVGMEPVALAARSNNEVWVVNHLSDSVSVVSLEGTPRVVRTLLVGDEPRDIVFAGSPAKAFVTTAHRGQHRTDPSLANVPGAGDPQLTTQGIGRADVWVFNPSALGNTLGGVPLKIMTFFTDTPRALAVSPDRNTLYVAGFKTGNGTASVNEELVCDGFENKACMIDWKIYPGGVPGPKTNFEGKPAPETSIIVKYSSATKKWTDELGRDWTKAMRFNLPDKDVFAVDANALTEKIAFPGVGTVLFNMTTNPVTGALYVSNTEANNMARFEGPGTYAPGQTLQGKIALARVTVIANSQVKPRHLNKHIDYSKLVHDAGYDASAKTHSLSMPMDMTVTRDGRTLYVTAYGSSRIGVFDTAQLESDTFNPRTASSNYITVSGGGPSGVVLDEARGRLYVMTRFDNAVKVVNLSSRSEVGKVVLNNPEPSHIVAGRPFLYDANRSSANGESSCASCHIFGDMDEIAWNLGNPDDPVTKSPIPGRFMGDVSFQAAKLLYNVKVKINGSDDPHDFHPMKGPMTTQTLKGMRNQGAMHWRGDRSTGLFGTNATDALLSFKNFAVAFEGLLGNPAPMSEAEMQTFADFQLNTMLPPNPIRNLDNSLTAAQQRGFNFYFGERPSDGVKILFNGKEVLSSFNCNGCHTLDPARGMYGTSGDRSFEGIAQTMKIPHLRNVYQKIGRFGAPKITNASNPDTGHLGDQIRGFGMVHDGTTDTLAHFFTVRVFQPTLNSGFPLLNPDATRRDVSDYMHAFDSDLAPIVGQQATLTAANTATVGPRIDLLLRRAKAPFVSKELGGQVTECDLVATVVEGGVRRGYLYEADSGVFAAADGTRRADGALRALATVPGQEMTYTCTPPGSGRRIAHGG